MKAQVQNGLVLFVASGGRITKASNWICEAVFSYPEELPLERLDEYNDLIIKYMNARFNNNVASAVCHLDEGGSVDGKGGLPHLHLDILMITEDNRLSAKTLITRDFITSMNRIMPIILKNTVLILMNMKRPKKRSRADYLQRNIRRKWSRKKKKLTKSWRIW